MSDEKMLMQHQHIHLWKMNRNSLQALAVFDDVGTGKTISALNIVNHHLSLSDSQILIVIPPALTEKWIQECEKWCNQTPSVCHYSQGSLVLNKGINLLSAGSLQGVMPPTLPEIDLLVVDEAHHFRNPETQASKILLKFCLSSNHRVLLTATPLQNSSQDLVTIIHLLLPTLRRSTVHAIIAESLGKNDISLLQPIVTRCIPETSGAKRVIEDHQVEMSEAERNYVFDMFRTDTSSSGSQLAKITKMKMAASSIAMLRNFTGHQFAAEIGDSKVEYTAALINNLCQDGKKVIVFSQFIETANALSTLLVENLVGTITGKTPSESRSAYLTGLQYSKRGGVIVMTDVGGEGLDMQFVDCIVNHDLPWNPMVLEQRIGRLDRIGRGDQDIIVHNILLKDSLDSHIISVLSAKGKLTKKFGGYGQMINSEQFTSIAESSFQFQALTAELYAADLEDVSIRNHERIESCTDELLCLIKELQC